MLCDFWRNRISAVCNCNLSAGIKRCQNLCSRRIVGKDVCQQVGDCVRLLLYCKLVPQKAKPFVRVRRPAAAVSSFAASFLFIRISAVSKTGEAILQVFYHLTDTVLSKHWHCVSILLKALQCFADSRAAFC